MPPPTSPARQSPLTAVRLWAASNLNDQRDPMNFDEFNNSLSAPQPPASLTPALAGLWWDAKGDWTRAHDHAQQDESREACWVHAYLHRKEGDEQNAAYWYQRAAKDVCQESCEAEWRRIVSDLVSYCR